MSFEARRDDVEADVERNRRAMGHLAHHWKSYVFQGALLSLVGLLALLAPVAATLASVLTFGILLILGGIVGIIMAFRSRAAPGFWPVLLLSVLALVLGVVFLIDPLAGSVTLVWALAIYFLLSGAINFSISRVARASTSRFWLFIVSGVIDIALAFFLILGLPATAVWTVGVVLGVSLVTSGLALIFAALDARNNPVEGI